MVLIRVEGVFMMKIAVPKPFTFKGGKRAVLLLHGFTGNSADVRMLGRFLEKRDIPVMLPIIKGTEFRQRSLYILDQKIGGRTL